MLVLISSVRIPGILNSRGTLKLKINLHEYPHRDRPIGRNKDPHGTQGPQRTQRTQATQ